MKIKRSKLKQLAVEYEGDDSFNSMQKIILKISTARCARLSYMTFNGEIDYQKDIELHDRLLKDHHMSPMEHSAMCKNDSIWYANFKGFISYRYLIENEKI